MKAKRKRLIVQIAYDQSRMFTRATLLQQKGFRVLSFLGSKAATDALMPGAFYDLFIIGHAAPERERMEMTKWLRVRYPKAKILALNHEYYPQLGGADFNVELDSPETWLAVVSMAFAGVAGSA